MDNHDVAQRILEEVGGEREYFQLDPLFYSFALCAKGQRQSK